MMELMHSNDLFSHNNLMKTQRIQYLSSMLLKKKQNTLVVKSLFSNKPPSLPPPPTPEPGLKHKFIMKPLQKVLKQIPESGMKVLKLIDTAIPDSELKVAVFEAAAGSLGWALPAIGKILFSIAQEDPLHFKEGDLVVYKGKDCIVNWIGSSTIILKSVYGTFRLDNSGSVQSMITNLSREITAMVGTRTIITFVVIFNVKEKGQQICDIILNYMDTNQYLKDQHLYNFAIIQPDDKVKVVGNWSCLDVTSLDYFETYTEIKSNIIADLNDIVDDNKPNPSCAMCKDKIMKAADLISLFEKGHRRANQ